MPPDICNTLANDFKASKLPLNRKSSALICTIDGCRKSFKRLDDLDRHEFHHTGIKKHKCPHSDCDKLYSIITHLKRHIRVAHELIPAPQKNILCTFENCNRRFSTKSIMNRHVREVHEKKTLYSCGLCNENFNQKLGLKRHEVKNHQMKHPYSCLKCSKGFYSQCQYDNHAMKCKTYFCQDCSIRFEKWTLYIKHCRKLHHLRKKPDSAQDALSKYDETRGGSENEVEIAAADLECKDPKYSCNVEGCGKSFRRLDHLDRHEFYHTGIKKHKCAYDGCGKSYSIITHLKRHFRTAHERTQPREKNVLCTVDSCDKMFTSHYNMQRHIRDVHNKPKVYSCSYCNEEFTQKLKLRRHEVIKHTGEYPFKCFKCSKGYYNQWQHDRHVSSCKVYICTDCSQQFDKWTIYMSHCKNTQHGRKYYKCDHCDRAYRKPGELQKHIVIKHLNQEHSQTFKCTNKRCEREYNYERNLRHHVLTVHEGRYATCNVEGCERRFSSMQNLANHVQRAHDAKEGNTKKIELPTCRKILRNKRKVAERPKLSTLAKLAGLTVDKELNKLLCERNECALEIVSATLSRDIDCYVQSGEDLSIQAALSDKARQTKPMGEDLAKVSVIAHLNEEQKNEKEVDADNLISVTFNKE